MNNTTLSIERDRPDPVAPDSLQGIPRQQTNAGRWNGEGWSEFQSVLEHAGVEVRVGKGSCAIYVTDAGGQVHGMPHGTVNARSSEQIATILKTAQKYRVPVTVRGGGLTTEGESVAMGGLLLDMSGMSQVLNIDADELEARVEAGINWHTLAEKLRRHGLDYLSAPLNLTASVGGTLGVGGLDVNSPHHGCSADQALALKVVTPTGEIVECSEQENADLFERVLFGYGQFGVITEATMRIRNFSPVTMNYFYYGSLRSAIKDMQMLVREDAADYCGILTVMDRAINLLVAFDSEEREKEFFKKWRPKLRGMGELAFALRMVFFYALHPWRIGEALYIAGRRLKLFPEFQREEFMRGRLLVDRTVIYSEAVWRFWGGKDMIIPDLSTNSSKFVEVVERGNRICKKYFKRYTLYCVGTKLQGSKKRYEMSCISADASGFGYGCEFEPMLRGTTYSRDYLQSFKNEIYDIGVDLGTSYYRFGGVMKGYIRRIFGDELVDKHLEMKRSCDPAMILNPNVVF